MKYDSFEDVPVWKDGVELAARIFELTEDPSFRFKGDVANQLQRAALSVSNNVAEGFERGTTAALISFLYIAKGSAGEVRSISYVLDRLKAFAPLRLKISDFRDRARSISRQLSAWAQALQDSEIAGQRHLTMQSRQSFERKKRGDAFVRKLKEEHEQRLMERERKRRSSGSLESEI